MGGLINPRPGRGQYRAGFSNTGGSPKPRKRAPCQKKGDKLRLCVFLAATSPKVARRIKVFGYLVKNAKYLSLIHI